MLFFAEEISISEAFADPDVIEWKNAIYNQIKSPVTNNAWEFVEK